MLNSLANYARSTNLRTMKSLAAVIWVPKLAMILILALLLGALGNTVGLSGAELALDFTVAAAGPGLLIPAKFSLVLFFLAAIHFGFCWDSTRIPARNLVGRLGSWMMESARLWSSTTPSAYSAAFQLLNDPNRRLSSRKRTASEGTSYLACDTPQLE